MKLRLHDYTNDPKSYVSDMEWVGIWEWTGEDGVSHRFEARQPINPMLGKNHLPDFHYTFLSYFANAQGDIGRTEWDKRVDKFIESWTHNEQGADLPHPKRIKNCFYMLYDGEYFNEF